MIAQEAYMINCESMNYELKEDESDFFNADTISQSSTKPDNFWAFAVARINSEEGGEIKKKNISDCSKKDIEAAIKKEINGIKDKDVYNTSRSINGTQYGRKERPRKL